MDIVTKPSFSFKLDKEEYEFYALREGQAVRNYSVREESGGAYFRGPGIVTVSRISGIVQYADHHVDDYGVWSWLSFLVNEGIPKGKVTSNMDQISAQEQYRKKLKEEQEKKKAEEAAMTVEDWEQVVSDNLASILLDVEEKFAENPSTWRRILQRMKNDIDENLRNI